MSSTSKKYVKATYDTSKEMEYTVGLWGKVHICRKERKPDTRTLREDNIESEPNHCRRYCMSQEYEYTDMWHILFDIDWNYVKMISTGYIWN